MGRRKDLHRGVEDTGSHDKTAANDPLVDLTLRQVEAIEVDIVRSIEKNKVHTDSPQNQRNECTGDDLVFAEQLFDSDVATAQAEDDDCNAEQRYPN